MVTSPGDSLLPREQPVEETAVEHTGGGFASMSLRKVLVSRKEKQSQD
jgi:hypothetical protein